MQKKDKKNTLKWIEIFDQSNGTYNKNNDIRFKTNQLRNDEVIKKHQSNVKSNVILMMPI